MTQLLIALTPFAVALVPILRWPTRERLLRNHLAFLKDVPTDVDAKPLRSLVEAEIVMLAARDGRWLTRSQHQRRVQLTARTALSILSLVFFVPVVLTPDFQQWFSRLSPDWQYFFVVYGSVLFVGVQWFIFGASLRYGMRRAEKGTGKP